MSEDRDQQPDAPPLEHGDAEVPTSRTGPRAGRGFSVWAPSASRSVDLELNGTCHAMVPAGQGWWTAEVTAEPGDRYGYRIDGGPVTASPRATRLPDGPHGLSAVFDPAAFEWTDEGWEGVALKGSVLYELHVGTFTAEGTFDAAIERLDHLVDLGVDVVEVMPVASFPGRFGLGLRRRGDCGRCTSRTAARRALQRFVDACHARGLGGVPRRRLQPPRPRRQLPVQLRPVLHRPAPHPVGRGAQPRRAELRPGAPTSSSTTSLHWLRDFHVDGLRLDAVHELHDDPRDPHPGGAVRRGSHALADELGRPLWLIAETDRNDPRTVLPAASGGLGMDGAVGRRRPPRAARGPDRRERRATTPTSPPAGRCAAVLAIAVLPRRHLLDLPRPPARPAPSTGRGRRLAVRRLPADPRPGRQPRAGDRLAASPVAAAPQAAAPRCC